MEIKNLRWVLTWHLKETDLARILEGRNAMLASICSEKCRKHVHTPCCFPCVSPRGGDPNATSRGEHRFPPTCARWAAASSSKEQQAAGKQLESWRQKKCYVSIDLLRKIQKTWPYPSQHYENLFLNMLYSCYVRCSLFPHSAFHLFELAKVWRCYVKHIRAPYLSHIRREKAHHPHGTAAIQKSHIR